MLNPHFSAYDSDPLQAAEEFEQATRQEWLQCIRAAERAAELDSRVQLESGGVAIDHELEQVVYTWVVAVNSLEPNDLANGMDAAAAAIRKAVAHD